MCNNWYSLCLYASMPIIDEIPIVRLFIPSVQVDQYACYSYSTNIMVNFKQQIKKCIKVISYSPQNKR